MENEFLTNHVHIESWLSIYTNVKVDDKKKVKIDKNGVVDITGSIEITPVARSKFSQPITQLPVRFGKVSGDFICVNNMLSTLRGAPHTVKKNFIVKGNNLTSLVGGPTVVGKGYDCSNNHLTDLVGSPEIIPNTFNCSDQAERLIKMGEVDMIFASCLSLVGSPRKVGTFVASCCGIRTLRGGPITCAGSYLVVNNSLENFDGIASTIGGSIDVFGSKITSLTGLGDLCPQVDGVFFDHPRTDINQWIAGGICLILVPGLVQMPKITPDNQSATARASRIIKKYLGRPDALFECQAELLDQGLDAFAEF